MSNKPTSTPTDKTHYIIPAPPKMGYPTGILNWGTIRTNAGALKSLLNNSSFGFEIDKQNATDTQLLVFPAVENKKLCFYYIGFNANTGQYGSTFVPAALQSDIDPEGTIISSKVARERMEDWSNPAIRDQWITNNINAGTIFNYFVINVSDLEPSTTHICFLGLRENKTLADIIIANISGSLTKSIQYDDMVHSVPPFSPNIGASANPIEETSK